VPFICKAGKALDEKCGNVRIQFRGMADSLYQNAPNNELVMQIQPDIGIS